MNKWTKRFMDRAQMISTWSKDPSTKVGAVIVDEDNHVISEGYNGFPKGVTDSNDRLQDRETKYLMVLHSELNAILFTDDRSRLKGATIYVYPLPPCAQCAAAIIQVGIKRVIAVAPTDEQFKRWGDGFAASDDMFREAGVDVVYIVGGI